MHISVTSHNISKPDINIYHWMLMSYHIMRFSTVTVQELKIGKQKLKTRKTGNYFHWNVE